jgi:O-antigen ligase
MAFWSTVAFMFTVPWEAAIRVGGLGRLSRAAGLAAASVWAVSVLARGRSRPPSAIVKAYFLFLIWNGLTLFWTIDAGATLTGFITYAQIFGMILVVMDLFESERQIEIGLQAFVLGAYVSCASILVNWITASPTRFPEHQRIKALGFEVDGIALIIALAIPAAWYLATGPTAARRSRTASTLDLAYLPVAFFALVLTGTRGAAVASVPTVVFVLWTLRNTRANVRLAAVAMVATAVASVVLFVPREPLQRIAGSVSDVAGRDTLSGRTDIWREGITTFFHDPVTGVGLDAHRAAVSAGKEAHNTALSVLVETGVVGFVLLVALVVIVVANVLRQPRWSTWYWRSQLAAVALGSMSLSLEDSKSVWILVTLAVASAAAARAHPDGTDASPIHPQRDASVPIPAYSYGFAAWNTRPDRP